MRKLLIIVGCVLACLVFLNQTMRAQTTAFTYQGSLTDNGSPANGNFDFQFSLFDVASGGSPIGISVSLPNVPVTNGIFSVVLNFGSQFSGANRFLGISVRQSGSPTFTILTPRQPIVSSPYAIKSLNSELLGGIEADAYIRNGASSINAGTQFSIGSLPVVRIPGSDNTFLGTGTGGSNSGSKNTFSGTNSGRNNTSGSDNSFFGALSGFSNEIGLQNSFFGISAGLNNIAGSSNSYFGAFAGNDVMSGSRISLFGSQTDSTNGITNGTAIGASAFVSQSNSLVLGSINGINGANSDTKVGIGTTAPTEKLDIAVNGSNIIFGGAGCPSGSVAIGLNGAFGNCSNYTVRGDGTNILINRPTGGAILFRENNGTTQFRINPGGTLQVNVLGTAGSTALCLNASNQISTCSSSMRYKTNVNNFDSGLSLIRKLRPVLFNWKTDGSLDLGLVAEEVAGVEPLLVTKNEKGETEGVKYDRVGVVLVNAVNEQQTQIESLEKKISEQTEIIRTQQEALDRQQSEIKRQQSELETLKKFICSQNPAAEICLPNQ